MAATWSLPDLTIADRAKRLMNIEAVRTDGASVQTVTVPNVLADGNLSAVGAAEQGARGCLAVAVLFVRLVAVISGSLG